jgi:hypothetical protein
MVLPDRIVRCSEILKDPNNPLDVSVFQSGLERWASLALSSFR